MGGDVFEKQIAAAECGKLLDDSEWLLELISFNLDFSQSRSAVCLYLPKKEKTNIKCKKKKGGKILKHETTLKGKI